MTSRVMVAVAAIFASVLSGVGVSAPVSLAASGPDCPAALTARTKPAGGPAPSGTVALIITHGWNGGIGRSLTSLGDDVRYAVGKDKVAVRYFDYSPDSAEWASNPKIASCFAQFVHNVTDPHHVKAVVAAHSMGGLAIRFASSNDYAKNPVTAQQVAEVVTIDTPHKGSPWGGTPAASVVQALGFVVANHALPPADAHADFCLQKHDKFSQLPRACPEAPYLPKGVDLTAIDGHITVRRTLFGVKLYDVDHGGDGIVMSDSAFGYPESVFGREAPKGYQLRFATARCARTTDETLGLIRSAAPPYPVNLLRTWVKAMAGMTIDGATMDDILASRLGLASSAAWAADTLSGFSCNHVKVVSDKTTSDTIAAAVKRHLPKSPKTLVSTAWPSASANWTIENRSDDPCFDASSGDFIYESVFASKAGQFACGASADSLGVCQARGQAVTCVVNYADRQAITFTSPVPARHSFKASQDPMPLQVTLSNGETCDPVSHDQAQHYDGRQGWLYCSRGGLLLTDKARGIHYFTKSNGVWTADYAVGTSRPHQVVVARAVFAG